MNYAEARSGQSTPDFIQDGYCLPPSRHHWRRSSENDEGPQRTPKAGTSTTIPRVNGDTSLNPTTRSIAPGVVMSAPIMNVHNDWE